MNTSYSDDDDVIASPSSYRRAVADEPLVLDLGRPEGREGIRVKDAQAPPCLWWTHQSQLIITAGPGKLDHRTRM